MTNNLRQDNQTLLSADEAAKYLQVPLSRIRSLTFSGKIPFIKMGRTVRYDLADLKLWVESLKKGNPND